MKTKFFLCIRPPVIETDDGDYVKRPPTVRSSYTTVAGGKTSGRRDRDQRRRKRVAVEKYCGQLSVKSNVDSPEVTPEKPVHKETQKASEARALKTVCLKKVSVISDDEVIEVTGGRKSNSGGYIVVSTLFFTMFFGKLFGILCTMIFVCSLYPHRKNDGNCIRMPEKMVVNWPEKGSPEEYKKRVIMAGLLERKSHYR